ncbi:MAG: histidine phosphatase family protein [Oscillospiraceae bacterium]|nr:histidine phosphatase family protein [Oscillospiraceae bacterium]
MRIFLVRHGESEANFNKRYSGQTDVKLTPLGIQQAQTVRPILEGITFDKVYSSDLSRAYDTQAQALPGYTAERTPLLREIDVGYLAGKSIPGFWAEQGGVSPTAKTGDYTPYGGENREQQDARIRKFMDFLETQEGENVAIFAHRGVLLSFVRNILGADISSNAIHCDNCAVFVVEYRNQKWSILSLNYGKKL